MPQTTKILICSVCVMTAVVSALTVLAHFKQKSNKIPIWRLNLEDIEIAKKDWEYEGINATNQAPTMDDLRPYLSDWVTNHISWTNHWHPIGAKFKRNPSCFLRISTGFAKSTLRIFRLFSSADRI